MKERTKFVLEWERPRRRDRVAANRSTQHVRVRVRKCRDSLA